MDKSEIPLSLSAPKASSASARMAMLALIPSAVAFNLAIATVVRNLRWPIYLDCMGGIATTLITGLWPGVIVAAVSQILGCVFTAPDYMLYTGTAVMMSVYAYLLGKAGGFKTIPRTILTGLGMGIVSAMVSFGITYARFGITSAGSTFVTIFYEHHGFSLLQATILSGLTCDPVDKIAECLIVVSLIRGVPRDLLRRFRGGTLEQNFSLAD